MSPSITLMVAATLTNGIGQSARLPWRLPKEMKYFQSVTQTAPEGCVNAVIMGRNTWESIPEKFRPLSRRVNLVVSRNENYLEGFQSSNNEDPKPTVHSSLKDAILHTSTASYNSSDTPNIHRTFIIGGATMYKEALGMHQHPSSTSPDRASRVLADRILLTRILSPAFEDCDVFMPEFRDVKGTDGEPLWMRSSYKELKEWVGESMPEEEQEEKGVRYEFQMWTRRE